MQDVTFAHYDTADYLKSEEDIAVYLEAVMEEGGDDPAYVARALGTVARARNMTTSAREAGMSRVGLQKALSDEENPTLATVLTVTRALGLRVSPLPLRSAIPGLPPRLGGAEDRAAAIRAPLAPLFCRGPAMERLLSLRKRA